MNEKERAEKKAKVENGWREKESMVRDVWWVRIRVIK